MEWTSKEQISRSAALSDSSKNKEGYEYRDVLVVTRNFVPGDPTEPMPAFVRPGPGARRDSRQKDWSVPGVRHGQRDILADKPGQAGERRAE